MAGCFSSRGSGERALRTGFGEGGDGGGGGGEGVINGRGGGSGRGIVEGGLGKNKGPSWCGRPFGNKVLALFYFPT